MQRETSTEEAEASGPPLIHGFVLPPAAAFRRVATCGPLQIASRSPSPWNVISDKDPSRASPERPAGDADEVIGSSPGGEDGPGIAKQGLMEFLAELPDTDDVPLIHRASVLAAQDARAKTFMAQAAYGQGSPLDGSRSGYEGGKESRPSSSSEPIWIDGYRREPKYRLGGGLAELAAGFATASSSTGSMRSSRRAAARKVKRAAVSSMWGEVSRRKWRPPGHMYSTELHVALRLHAKEQLMNMQSYTSDSGKRELRAMGKALSADGARSQEKRVAVLMICEVIPPAALKQLFGNHVPSVSEVENEVQSKMRHLDPQGIKQCVDSYIRLFSKITDNGISLDDWSVWRSNQYLAELQEEALQKYQTGRGAVKDGLVDAKPISDADDSDDDMTAEPQQHDPEELAGRVRSGHTAAMRARGNLVRLEQHFGFPVHMRSASLPIWEGELPLSVKHATPVSPFALRALQDFVANPESTVYAVNVGGSFLASNLGIVRTQQLQHAQISGKRFHGGMARGQARYAKDPKSRGNPQSVAIYKRGVAGCEQWFKRWRRTVRDVEQVEWAYRDFNLWE